MILLRRRRIFFFPMIKVKKLNYPPGFFFFFLSIPLSTSIRGNFVIPRGSPWYVLLSTYHYQTYISFTLTNNTHIHRLTNSNTPCELFPLITRRKHVSTSTPPHPFHYTHIYASRVFYFLFFIFSFSYPSLTSN